MPGYTPGVSRHVWEHTSGVNEATRRDQSATRARLDAAGAACATTYHPASGYQTTDVPYVAHHGKVYLRHNAVPVSTASQCTRSFKVYAQVVGPSSKSGYNRYEIEPSPYTLTFIRGLP